MDSEHARAVLGHVPSRRTQARTHVPELASWEIATQKMDKKGAGKLPGYSTPPTRVMLGIGDRWSWKGPVLYLLIRDACAWPCVVTCWGEGFGRLSALWANWASSDWCLQSLESCGRRGDHVGMSLSLQRSRRGIITSRCTCMV